VNIGEVVDSDWVRRPDCKCNDMHIHMPLQKDSTFDGRTRIMSPFHSLALARDHFDNLLEARSQFNYSDSHFMDGIYIASQSHGGKDVPQAFVGLSPRTTESSNDICGVDAQI
jgi:hypothetical protein